MYTELKNIASVQMGYSFRSRLETLGDGEVAVIQMKDLLDDNTVDCHSLVKIDMQSLKTHHCARKGDLIFRSRGQLTTAAILLDDPGTAVVAAPLFRIRVTQPGRVLPEYLNWYISRRDAQVYLTSRAEGSVQQMISKQAIEDMPIALPDIEQQQNIVELSRLAARERAILYRLAEMREGYIETMLVRIAKGDH